MSSSRKRGRITTGFHCCMRWRLQLAQNDPPVVMGPGSRSLALTCPGRRGERSASIPDSIFKEPVRVLRHAPTFPRREMPEFFKRTTLEITEGAGNAGCALHPRPRVQQKSTRVSNHRYTASTGIPCTMVLTVSFVISPVTGLFCHRHFAGIIPRTLAPASGRQDHTTSPSASASFVRAPFDLRA